MDEKIPKRDRDRIEALVEQYRHQLEKLYIMAYLQGQIDSHEDTVKKLQKVAACSPSLSCV